MKPKDPYADRPLPFVIGTEQWVNSTKVGLETSSSDSSDEDNDSGSDMEEKTVAQVINVNPRIAMMQRGSSSTSSESNDYNNDTSGEKDSVKGQLFPRSQDILNSDTEPTTPSSVLPKVCESFDIFQNN